MASYKQELIQLHQLLAEVRFHAMDEYDLPATIDNLDTYEDVGITSLDLNAEIDTQLEAVLALASDLATVFETAQTETQPVAESEAATPKTPAGPTKQTRLYDIANGTSETVEYDAGTASASDGEATAETAAADAGDDPRVIRGYEQDTSPSVELMDTSLLYAWEAVKEREDRKPMETWGSTAQTDSAPVADADATIDTGGETEQVQEASSEQETERQLAVDVETEAKDLPAEPDEPEQITLPTP